jgi:hypothetical protein
MISNLVALKDAVLGNGWLTLGTVLIFLVFLNYTQSGPDVCIFRTLVARRPEFSSLFKLRHIPAFGPQGRLTSYIGSYRFLANACGVVAEEVNKHPGGMFRVPFLDHWEVVVSGTQLVNELSKASDDDLSVIDAVADVLQTEFTMGESIKYDQYHVGAGFLLTSPHR